MLKEYYFQSRILYSNSRKKKKIGETLLGKDFLGMIPQGQSIKDKFDKLGNVKI